MMKIVKLKIDAWKRLIHAYRECRRANKALNKEIVEYNKKFADGKVEKR